MIFYICYAQGNISLVSQEAETQDAKVVLQCQFMVCMITLVNLVTEFQPPKFNESSVLTPSFQILCKTLLLLLTCSPPCSYHSKDLLSGTSSWAAVLSSAAAVSSSSRLSPRRERQMSLMLTMP